MLWYGGAMVAPALNRSPIMPRKSSKPDAAAPGTANTKVPGGKLGVLVGLLTREGGAHLEEMVAATGWQAHSVRGAMSGALKKKLGLTITSEKADGERTYRIVPAVQ